jgi:hypothetical protein
LAATNPDHDDVSTEPIGLLVDAVLRDQRVGLGAERLCLGRNGIVGRA